MSAGTEHGTGAERAAPLVIWGAGGFGREVAWLAESSGPGGAPLPVAAFLDDDRGAWGTRVNGIEVMGLEEAARRHPGASAVVAVGSPRAREALVARLEAAGFSHATLVHPEARMSRWVEIGEGSVVCAGNILTTNIRLGRHVHVNLDCTVGHDAVLEDYATLAPGVHVSGWVHIEKRVYVGTGAVFVNGTSRRPLVVGEDAVVGAGACVTRDVPAGATVVGVPAREVSRR